MKTPVFLPGGKYWPLRELTVESSLVSLDDRPPVPVHTPLSMRVWEESSEARTERNGERRENVRAASSPTPLGKRTVGTPRVEHFSSSGRGWSRANPGRAEVERAGVGALSRVPRITVDLRGTSCALLFLHMAVYDLALIASCVRPVPSMQLGLVRMASVALNCRRPHSEMESASSIRQSPKSP